MLGKVLHINLAEITQSGDVYKRQLLFILILPGCRKEKSILPLLQYVEELIPMYADSASVPVSYTHLDVYKRQGVSCHVPARMIPE